MQLHVHVDIYALMIDVIAHVEGTYQVPSTLPLIEKIDVAKTAESKLKPTRIKRPLAFDRDLIDPLQLLLLTCLLIKPDSLRK